jgi:hypothetical protein
LNEVKIFIHEVLTKTFQAHGKLPPANSQLIFPLNQDMRKIGIQFFSFEGTREYKLDGNEIRISSGEKDWLDGVVKKDCIDLKSINDNDITKYKLFEFVSFEF